MPSQLKTILDSLSLLNKLKIFPYLEYLERSKKYFGELLPRLPKNISVFLSLYNFVKLERVLENIITADE